MHQAAFRSYNFRIDDDIEIAAFLFGSDIEDDYPVEGAYLISGQTDARSLIHGIGHIIDKTLNIIGNLFHRPGFFLENRLRIFLNI